MISKKLMDHPKFMAVSVATSDAIVALAAKFGLSADDLQSVSLPLGAVDKATDDLTRFVLMAIIAKDTGKSA